MLHDNRLLPATLLAIASLTACGGGGGAGPTGSAPVAGPSPAPAPTPAPVRVPVAGVDFPLPAVTSVPAPSYGAADPFGAMRSEALNALNGFRARAGLGLLVQDAQLDTAAAGHARYVSIAGNPWDHNQVAGTSGFTGVTVFDRARSAGFAAPSDGRGVAETFAGWRDDAFGSVPTGKSIEGLVGAIYHRFLLLDPSYDRAGLGVAQFTAAAGRSGPVVVNIARSAAAPLGQDAVVPNGVVRWPPADAVDVPLGNGPEEPNPPGAGYAASLHCHNRNRLTVTSFVLREVASGVAVQTVALNTERDPGAMLQLTPCFQAIMGVNLLRSNTRYRAEFVGSMTGPTGTREVREQWEFTTGVRMTGSR